MAGIRAQQAGRRLDPADDAPALGAGAQRDGWHAASDHHRRIENLDDRTDARRVRRGALQTRDPLLIVLGAGFQLGDLGALLGEACVATAQLLARPF